jgi:hypothetical protein
MLYGKAGMGKSPLMVLLGRSLFGEEACCHLEGEDLERSFGLQSGEGAEAILLEEVDPRKPGFRNKLKRLMSISPVMVSRKYREDVKVKFQRKLFMMASNYPPEVLFGEEPEDREPLMKRFSYRLELANLPSNRGNEDGWDLKELEKEMDEVIIYALFYSSPEMEERLERILSARNAIRSGRRADRLLRKSRRELERLGIERSRLSEEQQLLRQQLEDGGQLELAGRLDFGEGHLPEEIPEGEENLVEVLPNRDAEFLRWKRALRSKDPNALTDTDSDTDEEEVSDLEEESDKNQEPPKGGSRYQLNCETTV